MRSGTSLVGLVALLISAPAFGAEKEPVHRTLIVWDGSGSSLEHADRMRAQVRAIVALLGKEERVNIYFASEDESTGLVIFPQLMQKIGEKRLNEFLEHVPHGADAMVEGIGWAVGQMPDVLWIITDGEMDNPHGIASILHAAESTRKFKIGVINLGKTEIDMRIKGVIEVHEATVEAPKVSDGKH